MTDYEFLCEIYKNTFYSTPTKRVSLNKISDKINKIENELNRELLYSACSRFANYDPHLNKTTEDIKKRLDLLIEKLVDRDYKMYLKFIKDTPVTNLFDINGVYKSLTHDNIVAYYTEQYVPKNIRSSIKTLITTSPEQDYPTARAMKRHFVLHIGPTNSGKTYESLERLKECQKGIYLGPLRLLALEVYDKFNRAEVPCNMITGEEELRVPDAVCQASTIEMLSTDDYYDIAVIDEAQMMADPARGYNWTKAILGLAANEIHVCMAYQAENMVKQLIERCNDTYEVHYHKRMTKLKFDNKDINYENFYKALEPGDALIVFSKKSVLAVASELEKRGIKSSVIYGNLPPDARKHQVELFTTGQTKIVVSTDAIGMGLNLPIRRIIFMETAKFDGTERRILNSQEIKQIAGRAGRRGLYEEGFCLSVQDREYISRCLEEKDEEIVNAPIGFPEVLLELPYDINYILQTWSEIKPNKPFVKMDVKELITLYNNYKYIKPKYIESNTKKEIYQFITCPVDLKDTEVLDDWRNYCKYYATKDEYELPVYEGSDDDLGMLESYYKRLDLYFQFSRKMKKTIKLDELIEKKKDTVHKINKILKETYKDFSKKCNICGKPLPIGYEYGMCQRCFKRRRFY